MVQIHFSMRNVFKVCKSCMYRKFDTNKMDICVFFVPFCVSDQNGWDVNIALNTGANYLASWVASHFLAQKCLESPPRTKSALTNCKWNEVTWCRFTQQAVGEISLQSKKNVRCLLQPDLDKQKSRVAVKNYCTGDPLPEPTTKQPARLSGSRAARGIVLIDARGGRQ